MIIQEALPLRGVELVFHLIIGWDLKQSQHTIHCVYFQYLNVFVMLTQDFFKGSCRTVSSANPNDFRRKSEEHA